MFFDAGQLAALRAAAATGSFDAAAASLHITPSAVSQRMRALEAAAGRQLLLRRHPVQPTAAGEVLLRLAQQVEELGAAAAGELGLSARSPRIPIAVNADSLDSWVLSAVAPFADRVRLEFHRADEHRTAGLLRRGEAMAAITTEPAPLGDFQLVALGAMDYRPVATAGFLDRWRHGAGTDWLRSAPRIDFDTDDTLQLQALARVGIHVSPAHLVPATAAVQTAVTCGMGWGMLPQAPADLRPVPGLDPIEVPLWWQQWRSAPPVLTELAEAVAAAARRVLSAPRAS